MKPALLLATCVLLLAACRRQAERHPVAEVRVSGATVQDNAWLGLDAEQVRARFTQALVASGRFELLGEEKETPPKVRPWRLTLELPFTREVQKHGMPHTYAEVGATLVLERFGADLPERYEVVGLGEARVEQPSPEARREALRSALEDVLRQLGGTASLRLAALERGDEALVQDLESSDERVREFALRTLAERRHPAAAPLLIDQLKSNDALQVRRAVGALVEMRARAAVPVLIDLARGKDMGFLQELIFAVGEIGGVEAEAYLFTVAQGHDQPAIQAAAQQALETLHASRKHGLSEARDAAPAQP